MNFATKQLYFHQICGKIDKYSKMLQYFENRRKTDMKLELLYEIAQTPTEGKLFEVRPLEIDRRGYFGEPLSDKMQEKTRQIINEAFAELDKQPQKYASPFYTLIPEKKWKGHRTVAELKAYARDLDGEMADWVEQALEWAQRIYNGEAWNAICNNVDTANWRRVIVWKNRYCRIVGSTRFLYDEFPASDVYNKNVMLTDLVDYAVPLITFRKK